uniref:nucleoside diphosphate phosphatase n=1 Tax=Fundulus heteroclitus TaxID=8078 RepID=A0A3Q2PUB7_FUNHE
MKPTAPLLLLVLLAAAGLSRAQLRTSLLDMSAVLPSLSRPANHSRISYAAMFDAGSTGTRIHVYTFIQSYSEQLPVLDNEVFHSIKPGLSAYADYPEAAGETVRMLLKVAKKSVPRLDWKRTPLVLRATAGLRLLPAAKAQALLDQVQHVFDESPFLVSDNSVSIMNGTNEGVLAWISLNFLTGHLKAPAMKTVGILDLGGGSTQITFLPKRRVSLFFFCFFRFVFPLHFCVSLIFNWAFLPQQTIESAPGDDYVARFDFLNSTSELYTHSYLGNGLMAGRLATLGALGAEGLEWQVFKSSCLPSTFRDDWSFGGLTYQVSGDPNGQAGYKLCYQEVLKAVKGIIHQPYELQDGGVFYAFSYYFDRAVDAGLINNVHGGTLQVRGFKKRAKEVCNKMTKYPPVSPFLCMDLTYITCLLKDGFGFKDSAVLQLTKKVKNVEASWALGAMLDHFHKLRIH